MFAFMIPEFMVLSSIASVIIWSIAVGMPIFETD